MSQYERWYDAEGELDSLFAAANQQSVASQARTAHLVAIEASSAQYADSISNAVQYFIDMIWERKAEMLHELMSKRSPWGESCETVVGSIDCRGYATHVEYRTRIDYTEWPRRGVESDARFVVQSDGRWYYGYTIWSAGKMDVDRQVCAYGFDEERHFVSSSFPPVERGTVVMIARRSLGALLHYYGLPLPS